MSDPEHEPPPPPAPEPSPLEPALRAAKAFLWPFMLSMAMAFIGSRRDIDWLYYGGLGGVGLSMIVLFVWLPHAQRIVGYRVQRTKRHEGSNDTPSNASSSNNDHSPRIF